VHSLSLKRCPPSQAYKSLEHFSAVALGVVDRLNPTSIFLPFKKNNDPAEAGPPVSLCSDELANRPASVRVANSTAPGCYHDRRDDRHAWSHHSAAVVNAAVVAIATAAAIWAAVKARSTATGDRNCQIGLCLLELSLSALLFNPEQKTFRRLSFLNAWNREILQSWPNDRDSPQVSPWSCAVVRAGLVSPSPGPFFLSKLGR
jgi:hypothetical protein